MILSLDSGTTAAKAALISADRTVRGRGESRIPTLTGPAGSVEQDPDQWIRAARSAIADAHADARASTPEPPPERVTALALTGQMQDLILLDADGEPLRPAILYADTRAAAHAERLRRDLPAWECTTGNLQDATSTAAQWLRLTETESATIRAARTVLFGPTGYLAHRLGLGAHVDRTTASTTGLFDLAAGVWADGILTAIGLDPALLPRLIGPDPGAANVGRIDTRAADLLGVPAGVPVVLAPGDAGAATLGTIGDQPGRAYVSLGTSGWAAQIVASADGPTSMPGGTRADVPAGASHQLSLPVPVDPRARLRISAPLAAGDAAAWSARTFLGGIPLADADARLDARERERGRGPSGLLALPSIHGERFPVRDETLRAAVVGMGASTDGVDIHRAVLEGVAFALAAGLDDPAAGDPAELAVIGGGAASAPWLRILADVTGRAVRTVGDAPVDAPLIGAAVTAFRALGIDAASLTPLAARPGGTTIGPDPAAHTAYRALAPRHRALYDVLGQAALGG